MTRTAPRPLILAAVMVVILGCSATHARPVGDVALRNDSGQSVRVEIDRPAGFAGPRQTVVWILPWRAGWCPAAHIGLTDQGSASTLAASRVTISGPSLNGPVTLPGSSTDVLKGGLSLTIDAAGVLRSADPEPPMPTTPCTAYPLSTGP